MFRQTIVSGTQSEFRNGFESRPVGYVGECRCPLLLPCSGFNLLETRSAILAMCFFRVSFASNITPKLVNSLEYRCTSICQFMLLWAGENVCGIFDMLRERDYLLVCNSLWPKTCLFVSKNAVGFKEPGQPRVNHSFHKFSRHACEEDRPIVVKAARGHECNLADDIFTVIPLGRYETGLS
nr:hypothetical protein HmN_000397400 [Hymenolepis microstoma]